MCDSYIETGSTLTNLLQRSSKKTFDTTWCLNKLIGLIILLLRESLKIIQVLPLLNIESTFQRKKKIFKILRILQIVKVNCMVSSQPLQFYEPRKVV